MIMIVSEEKLQKSKQNPELLQKLIFQIKKDFQLYGEKIEVDFNSPDAYNELFEQISPVIKRMLNLDSQRFFSLLYAIDIDEQKVKKLLFGVESLDAEQEITHLILERELLKVVSRHLFSQQQNNNTFKE